MSHWIAQANAQGAFDFRHHYASLEAAIDAHRTNAWDTALEKGADPHAVLGDFDLEVSQLLAVEQVSERRVSATQTTGHSAAQPGLRGHSVGSTYPWAIVAVQSVHAGDYVCTQWYAQNLLSGARMNLRGTAADAARDAAYQAFGA